MNRVNKQNLENEYAKLEEEEKKLKNEKKKVEALIRELTDYKEMIKHKKVVEGLGPYMEMKKFNKLVNMSKEAEIKRGITSKLKEINERLLDIEDELDAE